MKFSKYIDSIKSGIDPDKPDNKNISDNPDAYYWNMIDEDTGRRFNIPMLNTTSPTYFFDYVYYMKIKEGSPETFEKILNWD